MKLCLKMPGPVRSQNSNEQVCPICFQNVQISTRYPKYVCNECQINYPPKTENNENIKFRNINYAGGFESIVNNQITEPPIDICFIKGIKCKASEARFGGIVIEVI